LWHVAAAVWLLAALGCAAMKDERDRPFGFAYTGAVQVREPSAVVFMVDGVNSGIFRQMLEGGRLPNINKYIVSPGLYVEDCTCSIPSVTLANETSIVTGVFPGHHGITGINWFDRNTLLWRDYTTVAQKNKLDDDYRTTTIFERFPFATTFSIFYQAHRGATKFVENWTSAGPPYFFKWYHFVDRITLWRFDIVTKVAHERGEFPRFTMVYILAPDMQAYRFGASSPEYRAALEHTDAQIGRVLREFEAAGLLDKLIVGIVSDHGMGDVRKHFRLDDFMATELGLNVAEKHLWEEISFRKRLTYYRRFSAVLAGSGERYCAVYLRRPKAAGGGFENWLSRPSAGQLRSYPNTRGEKLDLPARLIAEEAVDAVAYRAGPNRVRVVLKKGTVEVQRDQDGKRFSYRVVAGKDPLGYEGKVPAAMLDGSGHETREWLEKTADTDFPDLIPQIITYFDARRSGDLAVFAAPGWEFNTLYRGGHGGIRAVDMHCPLLLAGPGVRHGRLKTARSVDLVPTLLGLMGLPGDKSLDGVDLFAKDRGTGT